MSHHASPEPPTPHLQRPRSQVITAVVLGLLLILVSWNTWIRLTAEQEKQVTQERLVVTEENAAAFADGVRVACEQDGKIAEQLGDICRQAERIVEDPAEPVITLPTEEQLRPLIRDYVDGWLTANPPRDGRTPTTAELSALIAAELERNPPADGHTPTAAEIRPIVQTEVAAWLTANPPRDGEDGDDGASAYEIAVASGFAGTVSEWLASLEGQDGADSTVPGPVGDTGPAGRGLADTPPEFVSLDDGTCVLRFFYTIEPLTTDTPLPKRFCQPDIEEPLP